MRWLAAVRKIDGATLRRIDGATRRRGRELVRQDAPYGLGGVVIAA